MRQQLGAAPSRPADEVPKSYADTKLDWQGPWSNTSAYSVNDVATYNGRTFLCTTAVAAAAASSFVGWASYTSDTAGVPPGAVNVTLPAGAAALDQLIGIINTTTAAAQTANLPSGASTVTPGNTSTPGPSSNFFNHTLFQYVLTSTDITNGYLTMPAQAGSPINQLMIFGLWRNVSVGGGTTTATATTPPITPGAAAYVLSAVFGRIGGGTTNTDNYATGVTASSYVNAIAQNTLNTNCTAMLGYETLASGTSTARTATITQGFNAGGSYGRALLTSSGTNTAPDQSGSWTALGDVTPAGALQMYAAIAAPAGYLLCDGTSYLRTAYPALFAAIGTAYGSVDGTHFTVPDLRARFPLGIAPTFPILGASGGAMAHSHALSDAGGAAILIGSSSQQRRVTTPGGWTSTHSQTGAASAVSAASQTISAGLLGATDSATAPPPYQVVNYIIKT